MCCTALFKKAEKCILLKAILNYVHLSAIACLRVLQTPVLAHFL